MHGAGRHAALSLQVQARGVAGNRVLVSVPRNAPGSAGHVCASNSKAPPSRRARATALPCSNSISGMWVCSLAPSRCARVVRHRPFHGRDARAGTAIEIPGFLAIRGVVMQPQ